MTTMTNGCLGFILAILGALGLLGILGVNQTVTPPAPFVDPIEPIASPTGFPTPTQFFTPTPTATPAGEARQAELGDQRGELPVGGGEVWTYEGEAGEIISISIRADDPANDTTIEEREAQGLLDLYTYIYDPDGDLLVEFDDIETGTLTDVQIDELELPASGTYRIEVRSWDNTNGGGYTLSIKSARDLESATATSTPIPTVTPSN
ncbi:MAG: hypothetical protein K8I82_13780 [Anaerolineae bacterium]|nr:hypothetical protein [Anaerolineae bacterium]